MLKISNLWGLEYLKLRYRKISFDSLFFYLFSRSRSLITERFSPEYTLYQKFPMCKHTSRRKMYGSVLMIQLIPIK